MLRLTLHAVQHWSHVTSSQPLVEHHMNTVVVNDWKYCKVTMMTDFLKFKNKREIISQSNRENLSKLLNTHDLKVR